VRPRAGDWPHRESRVRRSPHLGTHAAAITTAVVLVLASGAAAGTGAGSTVTLRVTTNGVVTVTPGQRICARSCTLRFRRGAVIALRGTPPPNFVFRGWTGGCVGDAPICVLALDRATSVRAAFVGVPEVFELTVSGPGTVVSRPAGIDCGAGHSDSIASFPWGTTVEMTAVAGTSGRFVRWGDACSSVGDGVCRLVAQGFTRALATFASAVPASSPQRLTVAFAEPRPDLRLVSSPSGIDCPTACEASFPSVTVVALRPLGFGAAWSGGCQSGDAATCSGWNQFCTGKKPKCKLSVAAPMTVGAVFRR
jgi:hypothetical protein